MTDCDCSRREILTGFGVLGAAAVAAPRLAFAASPAPGDVLVTVFLRGGMDGLSAVAPYTETAYHAARPYLRVPSEKVLRLDGRFGFHPALKALLPLYARRDLAVVHAVGSPVLNRSHFDMQQMIERGTPGSRTSPSGWLGRHLAGRPGSSSFRAVALGNSVQASLYGPVAPVALRSIKEFTVRAAKDDKVAIETTLDRLYAGLGHGMATHAGTTLAAIRRLRPLAATDYKPRAGVVYPKTSFGSHMSEVARLVKARVGLEAACVDFHGWDTHSKQGSWKDGPVTALLGELAAGLAAFYNDLGGLQGITVVVMSEFGRRVDENGSGGTDHGNGGVMFVLGGGIRGGRVYGSWPSVAKSTLLHGDLRPTTDYRDVLADVLYHRMHNRALGTVFPGLRPRFPGLADPR